MATIFISYRRADSADSSGRIYDRLTERFGRENVFKDVDSIPAGVNFPDYIAQSIQASDVALIIIGPRWLEASAGFAQRRLDDPTDFVRIEIETALRLGITVIPVLVGEARMPAERRLPASLRPLLQQNGLQVRQDPDFSHDMDRVIAAIDYWQRQPRRTPAPPQETAPALVAATDNVVVTITPAPKSNERVAEVARTSKVATALAAQSDTAPTHVRTRIRPLAPILIAVAALLIIAVGVSMFFSGPWQRLLNPPDVQATRTASAMATAGRSVYATGTAEAKAVAEGYTPSKGIGPCADKTEIYNVRDFPYYWEALNAKLASCSGDNKVVTFAANENGTSGATYHGRPGIVRFPRTFTASFTVVFANGATHACADMSAFFTGDPSTVPAPTGRVIEICGDGTWRDVWDNSSSWRNFALPNTTAQVSIYVSKDHVIFTVNGTRLTDTPGSALQFDQISILSLGNLTPINVSIKVSDFTITPS